MGRCFRHRTLVRLRQQSGELDATSNWKGTSSCVASSKSSWGQQSSRGMAPGGGLLQRWKQARQQQGGQQSCMLQVITNPLA